MTTSEPAFNAFDALDALDLPAFTEKIRAFNIEVYPDIESIHAAFWPELALVRRGKVNLEDWVYAEALRGAEKAHEMQKSFDLLTWEQSFTLDFIYSIHH